MDMLDKIGKLEANGDVNFEELGFLYRPLTLPLLLVTNTKPEPFVYDGTSMHKVGLFKRGLPAEFASEPLPGGLQGY